MSNGEFEGQTLDGLHAMLQGSDPAKLAGAGNALGDAGPKIVEVGRYLRGQAGRVEWRGEGADAFHEWVHDFALEVSRLGHFASAVGGHMVNAGQALTEAKAAVPKPVDAEKAHGDPDADKALIVDGTTRLQQAIHQMERLSSYYRAAREDMGAEREPEFKPAPFDGKIFDPDVPYAPDSSAAGKPSIESAAVRPQSTSVRKANRQSDQTIAHGVAPSENLGMGLDAVVKPPTVDVPPVRPHTATSTMPASAAEWPFHTLPARGSSSDWPRVVDVPGEVRTPIGRAPSAEWFDTVRPATSASSIDRTRSPRLPGASDGQGREAPGLHREARSSRGLVVGEEGAPAARRGVPGIPLPGGEQAVSGRRGYGQAHSYAAQPGAPALPTASSPQGVAAGDEQRGSARGPLSGVHGGVPTAGPGSPRSPIGGRQGAGMAIEPGGVAAAQPNGAPRRDGFTPGGTGLVRGANSVPVSERMPRRSDDAERRNESAWPLGRDTVPPVID